MTPPLDAVLAEAFACLAEGADSPASVWHTPTLANIDAQGFACQRSVVLRAWHAPSRRLEIHTDTRSDKVAPLRHNPKAALHGWDVSRRVQLRLHGTIHLHTADAVAQAAWARLRPASRATYGVVPGPGIPLANPADTIQADEDAAFAVFCVLAFTIDTLEWLHLTQGSHVRARFGWDNDVPRSMWLVP